MCIDFKVVWWKTSQIKKLEQNPAGVHVHVGAYSTTSEFGSEPVPSSISFVFGNDPANQKSVSMSGDQAHCFALSLATLYQGSISLQTGKSLCGGQYSSLTDFSEFDTMATLYSEDQLRRILARRLATLVWLQTVNSQELSSLMDANTGSGQGKWSSEQQDDLKLVYMYFGQRLVPWTHGKLGDMVFANPQQAVSAFDLSVTSEYDATFPLDNGPANTSGNTYNAFGAIVLVAAGGASWHNLNVAAFTKLSSVEFKSAPFTAQHVQNIFSTAQQSVGSAQQYHLGWLWDSNALLVLNEVLRTLARLAKSEALKAAGVALKQVSPENSQTILDFGQLVVTMTLTSLDLTELLDTGGPSASTEWGLGDTAFGLASSPPKSGIQWIDLHNSFSVFKTGTTTLSVGNSSAVVAYRQVPNVAQLLSGKMGYRSTFAQFAASLSWAIGIPASVVPMPSTIPYSAPEAKDDIVCKFPAILADYLGPGQYVTEGLSTLSLTPLDTTVRIHQSAIGSGALKTYHANAQMNKSGLTKPPANGPFTSVTGNLDYLPVSFAVFASAWSRVIFQPEVFGCGKYGSRLVSTSNQEWALRRWPTWEEMAILVERTASLNHWIKGMAPSGGAWEPPIEYYWPLTFIQFKRAFWSNVSFFESIALEHVQPVAKEVANVPAGDTTAYFHSLAFTQVAAALKYWAIPFVGWADAVSKVVQVAAAAAHPIENSDAFYTHIGSQCGVDVQLKFKFWTDLALMPFRPQPLREFPESGPSGFNKFMPDGATFPDDLYLNYQYWPREMLEQTWNVFEHLDPKDKGAWLQPSGETTQLLTSSYLVLPLIMLEAAKRVVTFWTKEVSFVGAQPLEDSLQLLTVIANDPLNYKDVGPK